MLGRVLGGIATSLLFSAFKSWLVAEHNKESEDLLTQFRAAAAAIAASESNLRWDFLATIMKMRSQYIPEEARSTIMNFFRIHLNIFVCIALYNVKALPMTVMFGKCSIFLFVASMLQRRLMVIAEIHKSRSQDWMAMKEMDSEADALNG
ncbi:hypothetical protein CRYUN_Cryun13aG0102900 [Craigia yunnanensis]